MEDAERKMRRLAAATAGVTALLIAGTAAVMYMAPAGKAGYIGLFMAAPIVLLALVLTIGVRDLKEAKDEGDVYEAEHRSLIGGGLIFAMAALVLLLTAWGM